MAAISDTTRTTQIASETIALLELRLRNLEFLLKTRPQSRSAEADAGDNDPAITTTTPTSSSPFEPPSSSDKTIAIRLENLEKDVQSLAAKSPAVQELLALYTTHPTLFQPISSSSSSYPPTATTITTTTTTQHSHHRHHSSTSHSHPHSHQRPPLHPQTPTLPTPLQTPQVLSHLSLYPSTSSQLTSLHDHPIPSSAHSTTLISLQPRLDHAKTVQQELENEVAVLRARSAQLVQRWLDLGVVAGAEVWGEWEDRLKVVERDVRRVERGRERLREEI